jgi:general secretion pathway protein A
MDMEYFESLNLRREPFSSSPDPDMFYRSRSQLECLRQLEIAIRLRRGLNIVLGAVGSGKTTICRQLFRELGHGGEIDPCLVLDPGSDDPADFVLHLSRSLGVPVADPPGSLHELMENVKSHLFDQGVIHRRIVCLVIDEGQKISPGCLEILRELLNYETNEFKLLQIVIFAQIELMDLLLAQPNLADRVNYLHTLAPFSLRETRDMIAARLSLAAVKNTAPPRFTAPAVYLAHLKGGGYPRRIVRLCHKALLAVSASGKKTVGAMDILRGSQTQVTPAELAPPKTRRTVLAAGLILAVALVCLAALVGPGELWRRLAGQMAASQETALPAQPQIPDAPQTPAQAEPDQPVQAAPAAPEPPQSEAASAKPDLPAAPAILGRAVMLPGWTLAMRLEDLYGRKDEALLAAVASANPDVEDIAAVPEGVSLAFPAIAAEAPAPNTALVSLARVAGLDEGFAYLRGRNSQEQPLRLLAYAGPDGKVRFEVVLAKVMPSRAEAEKALAQLPQDMSANARVIAGFAPGAVVYTSLLAPKPKPKRAVPRPQAGDKPAH